MMWFSFFINTVFFSPSSHFFHVILSSPSSSSSSSFSSPSSASSSSSTSSHHHHLHHLHQHPSHFSSFTSCHNSLYRPFIACFTFHCKRNRNPPHPSFPPINDLALNVARRVYWVYLSTNERYIITVKSPNHSMEPSLKKNAHHYVTFHCRN